MKAFNFILIFLLFIITCYSQAPIIESWDKRFGGTNDDEFFSFQQTTDKGYILAGQSESPISGNKTQNCRGGYDYWIVKIDSASDKQWDVRFGTSGDDLIWVVQQTSDEGYIISGFTGSDTSYDKTSFGWGGSDFWIVKTDANGNKQWDKDYGGTQDEYLYAFQQTKDRGYIMGGPSWSGAGGDKTQPNWDPSLQTPDYWVIKIDSTGNKQWDKRFGGTSLDQLVSIIQTKDGGYLLGGATESDSGCDLSQPPSGFIDYWVVKIDSAGNKQWDKRFGAGAGSGCEFFALQQANDGGYILGGYTAADSGGDKTQNTFGDEDYWVIKLDNAGNKLWDKDYGGPGADELTNISGTTDGGYLFSGNTTGGPNAGGAAGGDKSENNMAEVQTWIVKTDAEGNKQWDKTILSPGNNNGYAIQTNDNCYLVATQTVSSIGGYKTQPNWDTTEQTDDYWIVKFCFTGYGEGIKEITSSLQFNVYPNPFTSELDITIAQANLTTADFSICNILGQTVFSQHETNLSPTFTKMLDLHYLPNGVYMVEVVVNGEVSVKEVIKQ